MFRDILRYIMIKRKKLLFLVDSLEVKRQMTDNDLIKEVRPIRLSWSYCHFYY